MTGGQILKKGKREVIKPQATRRKHESAKLIISCAEQNVNNIESTQPPHIVLN